jgi:hypothetical protein
MQHQPAAPSSITDEPVFVWTARVSLVRSGVVLRQLALALGLPIIMLALFMLILEWPPDPRSVGVALWVAGIVAGIFLVLLAIVLGLVYRGGYEYRYVIDSRGIRATTHGRTAATNRIVNLLLLFSGSPSAAGAGILAAGRQSEFVAWSRVSGVEADAGQRTIALLQGGRPVMLVACDTTQYAAVLEYVRAATAR